MGVAVTDRRIRRHHVQIAVAVLVPQPDAFSMRDDDRQRIVIARARREFELDQRGFHGVDA